MKKKLLLFFLSALLVTGLAACGSSGSGSGPDREAADPVSEAAQISSETELQPAEDPRDTKHTIAVLVYNYSDDEVAAFRTYLQEYIAPEFNVEFIYSDSILSAEEEMAFIENAADAGAEGIMSFNTYDLKAETDLCAEKGIYYMLASGTVSNEQFAAAEDNPYFLGVVGPGSFIEYKAGSDMANYFMTEKTGNEYFILSGGAPLGNEMHLLRTEGILDTLKNAYGVEFDRTTEELAKTETPLHVDAGDLHVCICPGYIDFDEYYEQARTEYEEDQYQTVLSVLPISRLADALKGSRLGVVDCYSETNRLLFANGQLEYLVGKYSSIIGPSFAAMYNALTGYAEDFRIAGKAFHLTQGFWTSDSDEDFDEKYVLARSITINAYDITDLQRVIKAFNPEAKMAELKTLTEAYTFKDAIERRFR